MSLSDVSAVGKSFLKEDGPQLASGTAIYVDDLHPAGVLYGAVVRAGRPHARIRSVDVSRASRMKGVACILTGADIPVNRYGMAFLDQPILCDDKVRYEGDPVVALCAESWEAAAEAARRVKVEYEDLPPVIDPEEALRPGAPLLHEDHPTGNLVLESKVRKGDVEAGFAAADFIVEERYYSRPQEHTPIETHICMAEVDPAGRLTLHVSSQTFFGMRAALSRVLGLPISRIRLVREKVGGGFGGKHVIMLEAFAALCTMKTGRPVKFRMTREEEFIASTIRHSFVMDYKTGVTREGKIIASKIRLLVDGGAYCHAGGNVVGKGTLMAPGPYQIENVQVDSSLVYTNNGIAGAIRGFGVTQVNYACECHMDSIARRLKLDPAELRRRNAMGAGGPSHSGEMFGSGDVVETLDKATRAVGWESIGGGRKSPCGTRRRGRGMASQIYPIGSVGRGTPSGVIARVNEDATLTLWVGASDVGQGVNVIMRQIGADQLGIPFEHVHIVAGDTDITPLDTGCTASRTTHIAGNAVCKMVGRLKERMLQKAAEMLEASVEDIEIGGGEVFVSGAPDRKMRLAEVAGAFHRSGELLVEGGAYLPQGLHVDSTTGQGRPFECYVFSTHCAEVEVDEETGEYHVLQLAAAHDVGRAINPMNVEGQIEGGASMGLGMGTMERIQFKDGKVLNPDLENYLIPTSLDMPDDFKTIIVEGDDPTGPFGAKGVGEPCVNPTTPAILNAIYDAVGVQLTDLPATPEDVLLAMRGRS